MKQHSMYPNKNMWVGIMAFGLQI